MKRKSIYLLVIYLLIGILAACSNKADTETENGEAASSSAEEVNKEGFPIVDEQITLSLMAPGTGIAEWKDMPTLQEYAEQTNIDFEYITPPMSDFQTRLNLAFASGDTPDIIFAAGSDNLTPAMEVDYGRQGVLLPLEDLIDEYAPNFKALMEENPEIRKSITTNDGHIYALPVINQHPTSAWPAGPLWYNGEWLETLGVEELPQTTDELYELLVRFRDEDPNGNGEADEIPLIDVKMNSSRAWFLAAFGMKAWGIEAVGDEVRYAPTSDNYLEYLTYMHQLYDENLLDPETFSHSDEQKKAKGQEDRLGLFPDWFSFFTTGQPEEEAINNPMFQPLTSDISPEIVLPGNPGINRGAFAITNNNEHPEASIRWVDYLYSQEGRDFFDQGPEGYLWEMGEDGEREFLDIPEEFDSSEDYRGSLTPAYGIPVPMLVDLVEGSPRSDFDLFIEAETQEKVDAYAETPYPLTYLTDEEQEIVNGIEVDLMSYVEQMEAKFITGVEPLSNWDAYVSTIESMNVDQYVEIHQEAYDRWASN
ncbi:extracellular solute-binding protein [Gracilibacillus alcaliphilus]|uniref:extracellular solute-binding protein n=1 Tax=Gracilibacillus alcaliphilus TaxID=1401441 RepID=UPI00195C641E|nr:extracellular solute-binding protein [Gracilibacillus alcaliphilus]MBM7676282.1 putative aldouronate transport system substrate-binding protein [Gracilibacillus alcaliphilus]